MIIIQRSIRPLVRSAQSSWTLGQGDKTALKVEALVDLSAREKLGDQDIKITLEAFEYKRPKASHLNPKSQIDQPKSGRWVELGSLDRQSEVAEKSLTNRYESWVWRRVLNQSLKAKLTDVPLRLRVNGVTSSDVLLDDPFPFCAPTGEIELVDQRLTSKQKTIAQSDDPLGELFYRQGVKFLDDKRGDSRIRSESEWQIWYGDSLAIYDLEKVQRALRETTLWTPIAPRSSFIEEAIRFTSPRQRWH